MHLRLLVLALLLEDALHMRWGLADDLSFFLCIDLICLFLQFIKHNKTLLQAAAVN